MTCSRNPAEVCTLLTEQHLVWFGSSTASDATISGAATQFPPNVSSPSGSQVITDAVSTPQTAVCSPSPPILQASSLDPLDAVSTPQRGAVCSPPQSSSLHPLDDENFLEITEYLMQMEKTHVYNLGLILGLSQHKVKAMKDTDTFLDDVITAWLRKEDQVIKRGEPSWTVLVSALKHRRVGQTGIASIIAKDKGLSL